MRGIIDFAYSLLDEVIGFKALFLHSLPEAEGFYGANVFNPVEICSLCIAVIQNISRCIWR